MAKKKKGDKTRNLLVEWAWRAKANAAGSHGDKKKESRRKACRKKVEY